MTTALLRKDNNEELHELYEELMALPIDEGFPYVEPSTLEEIKAERPDGKRDLELKWDKDRIYEQILGAWLGRAAGCLLGKPVEGWPKARIDKYLKDKKIEILDDYLPFDEKFFQEYIKYPRREI